MKELEEEKKAHRQKVLFRLNNRTKYASRSMIPQEQKVINPLAKVDTKLCRIADRQRNSKLNDAEDESTREGSHDSDSIITEERSLVVSLKGAEQKSSRKITSTGKMIDSFHSKELVESQCCDFLRIQRHGSTENHAKPRRRSPSSRAIRKLSCHLHAADISRDSSNFCDSPSSDCSVHMTKTTGRIRLQDSRGRSFVISSDSSGDEESDDESYQIQKYSPNDPDPEHGHGHCRSHSHSHSQEVQVRKDQKVTSGRFECVATPQMSAPPVKYSLAPPPVPPPPCTKALNEECQKAA